VVQRRGQVQKRNRLNRPTYERRGARHGLYRIWIIGSIIWIGYNLWTYVSVCRFTIANPRPSQCELSDKYGIPWGAWQSLASGALIALAIGYIVVWVIKGFRCRRFRRQRQRQRQRQQEVFPAVHATVSAPI
jgi:hypothetical protein